MNLKDSGARREFGTGAVRDIQEDKGRCDLLPLEVVSELWPSNEAVTPKREILECIGKFVYTGNREELLMAVQLFSHSTYGTKDGCLDDLADAMLDLSHHYEDGARKYAERNWEKGIPLHCYIDSGVRHLLKFFRGDTDEPHHRAFMWNMLCALHTMDKMPEMIDLPFKDKENNI